MSTRTSATVYDVFKTQGQPTITYVARDEGVYERKLAEAINNRGTVCLLTGPSKTGKTTLYTRIADTLNLELIRVRCDKDLTARHIWLKALEDVDFERLSSRQAKKGVSTDLSGEIGGSIGWGWLAGLTDKVGTNLARVRCESETRERILAEASPSHLVPVLKHLPALFVLEDFHYLTPDVQKTIFQQWKVFVDNEISLVTVGTTHHAVDLAYGNKDLLGRLTHIDVPTWKARDLERIAQQGFEFMNISIAQSTMELIAAESVGLPIVTQAVSLQLLLTKDVTKPLEVSKSISITSKDAFDALHTIAIDKFGAFEAIYDRLCRGLRKQRKYKCYELILTSFTHGELCFSATRNEIAQKVRRLPVPDSDMPPVPMIGRTLSSLATLQAKMGIELLEWREQDDKLYIIEPTFLFYLRWRKSRTQSPTLDTLLKELSEKITALFNKDGDKKIRVVVDGRHSAKPS